MTGIDEALDRLDRALVAAGLPTLTPMQGAEGLGEIERAVAPHTLPSDLRGAWERADLTSLRARSWSLPSPLSPASALATHRQNQEEFPLCFGPSLLFPIARDSGDQWSIELGSHWSGGGAVFSQVDSTIRLEYAGLGDLVEVYAELLERGAFVLWENGYASFEREAEGAAKAVRLGESDLRELYDRREFSDLAHWPSHWLAAAGIDIRDREPLGATHAIRDLEQATGEPAVHARVAGLVTRLTGSSAGMLAMIDDGTGTLSIWCPAGVSPWGPRHRQQFEFEVVLEGGNAVASAVRPLDGTGRASHGQGDP